MYGQLDLVSQLPYRRALASRYLSRQVFRLQQYLNLEVISPLPLDIRHRINGTDPPNKLAPQLIILLIALDEDQALFLLLALEQAHLGFEPDGLDDKSPSVSLNDHQLKHVALLIVSPLLI